MAVAFVSTPAATIKAAASSGSFASFSPNAGSGYLVVVSLDTNQSGVPASTVAWASGGSGVWKKMASFNFNQFQPTIEVWAVHCTAAPGASVISVTGNGFVTSVHAPIREMTGHDTTLPTTGGTATATGSPFNTITCTPNTTGSRIVFGALDRNEGFAATANAATTLLDSWNNGGSESYAGFGASTTASTAQTLGVTNTLTANIQLALEILPATGGSQTGAIAVAGAGLVAVGPVVTKQGVVAPAGAGAVAVAPAINKPGIVAAAGAGAVAINATHSEPGVLTVVASGAPAVGGLSSELGNLAVTGAGLVTLGGVRTQSGALTVSGSVSVAVAASDTVPAVIAVQASGAVTIAQVHTELGALASAGAGLVTVNGASGTTLGVIAPAGAGVVTLGQQQSELAAIVVTGSGLATVGAGADLGAITVSAQAAVAVSGSQLAQGAIAVVEAGIVTLAGTIAKAGVLNVVGGELVTLAGRLNLLGTLAVLGAGQVSVAAPVGAVDTPLARVSFVPGGSRVVVAPMSSRGVTSQADRRSQIVPEEQ